MYDKATKEFIVNTPTALAQKYWITNGAVHAKHCVVFAQLSIDGRFLRQFQMFYFEFFVDVLVHFKVCDL